MERDAWWSELTGREPLEVRRLLDISESVSLRSFSIILGVGYAPSIQENEWRPLLLLDAEMAGMRPRLAPIPAERLDFPLPSFVYDIPNSLVLPVSRPEALSGIQVGQSVRDRFDRETVTIGIRAIRHLGGSSWQPGFITAGHAFQQGQNTEVYSVASSALGRYLSTTFGTGKRLGTVALHESPLPPDGQQRYDFAFVDLEYEEGDEWDPHGFLSELPSPPNFSAPREVTFKGGASGKAVRGTLMGALMGMECWRDCWMFGPTCAVKKGDSGSAVTAEPGGENLGVLVGRSVVGEQEHHVYVQSLARILAERLHHNGVLIEQSTNGG